MKPGMESMKFKTFITILIPSTCFEWMESLSEQKEMSTLSIEIV